MTRRGGKSTTHVHRSQAGGVGGGFAADVKGKELLLRKHRLLRRATGFMLARKYRNVWSDGGHLSDYGRFGPASVALAHPPSTSVGSSSMLPPLGAPKGYTREELINFWKDLSVVAKRALLRIHREVYLTALDQFLVRQNLCCECHDNVIAEWEDHERRRSGTRSLQDVFSVFPPFMDDEDDDDDDDDDDDEDEDDNEEDDEGDETEHERRSVDSEDELLEAIIDQDDDEVVFNYELEGGRPLGSKSLSGEEYLAALEDRKRSEVELMRLIQKEERYIIIREDHTDFIIDLIRCGEQFSYVSPCRPTLDDDESDAADEDEEDEEDDDDDGECPGANTSHLAQEYLLEVLAIKFREHLENAYQAALQHSLAVQAELLRDEIADLQASTQKSTSSNKKKKQKEKKKQRKKKEAAAAAAAKQKNGKNSSSSTNVTPTKPKQVKQQQEELQEDVDTDTDDRDPEQEQDAIDREVEAFRVLLEKIHAENTRRPKQKLVLPPGSFANRSNSFVQCHV